MMPPFAPVSAIVPTVRLVGSASQRDAAVIKACPWNVSCALPGADRRTRRLAGAGGDQIRARRQRLQGGREIVVARLERALRARHAVDGLQLVVELGAQVGVVGARRLPPQLPLPVLVEDAI